MSYGNDRPSNAFQQMLRDAVPDHLMLSLSINGTASPVCVVTQFAKVTLRREYAIKLFAVEGVSEDEDEYTGMLFEATTEVWSELYSRNLSRETKKGRHEKARQKRDGALRPNPQEQPGLLLAMESYATSQHRDHRVAQILNSAGYITKQDKPFSADMVREMLQNRTHIGFVRYQPFRKKTDGSRDISATTECFPGQHKPIVPIELFERCQAVRRQRQHHPRNISTSSIYHCPD